MIRYRLKCDAGHAFEAWFRSSEAFDQQRTAGRVGCAVCGSTAVEKAIMAPAVAGSDKDAAKQAPGPGPLSRPASPVEAKLAELRRHIEATSDYVGRDFADEARKIHEGEADKRSIWGEASLADAKALHDDGVPVAPIPWMRRTDG
jgi:hypothetical protein